MQGGAVPHAALDAAHVTATDSRSVGKRLLRKALTLPNPPDAVAETSESRMSCRLPGRSWHGKDGLALHPFRPRPIGYNVKLILMSTSGLTDTACSGANPKGSEPQTGAGAFRPWPIR